MNPEIAGKTIPNWFYNWWNIFGPSLKILPNNIRNLYNSWYQNNTLDNNVYSSIPITGQYPCMFFIQLQIPWIWRWSVTNEKDRYNIPVLRRNFFYKWWNKISPNDINERNSFNMMNLISSSLPNKGPGEKIKELNAEINQLKNQLSITKELLKNLKESENLPFRQFSKKLRFLGSFKRKFFSEIPEEIKEIISSKILSSTNAKLMALQKFLQELTEEPTFKGDMIIQQPLYLGKPEIPMPLLAKIVVGENTSLPEELISKLFHSGFIYQIIGTPENDDLFGPRIYRLIKSWHNASWNYTRIGKPTLIINVYSSHPYETIDHFHPAKHHLVLGYSNMAMTVFRSNYLQVRNETSFYHNEERIHEFSSSGLELLAETTIISLWVPRTYFRATEKVHEFPYEYSLHSISEEDSDMEE